MLNDEKTNQRSNSKTVRFTNNNINKQNDVKNIDNNEIKIIEVIPKEEVKVEFHDDKNQKKDINNKITDKTQYNNFGVILKELFTDLALSRPNDIISESIKILYNKNFNEPVVLSNKESNEIHEVSKRIRLLTEKHKIKNEEIDKILFELNENNDYYTNNHIYDKFINSNENTCNLNNSINICELKNKKRLNYLNQQKLKSKNQKRQIITNETDDLDYPLTSQNEISSNVKQSILASMQNNPLFNYIEVEYLNEIINKFNVIDIGSHTTLIKENKESSYLYIVISGILECYMCDIFVKSYIEKDIINTECLNIHSKCQETVISKVDSTLLCINGAILNHFLKDYQNQKRNKFINIIKSSNSLIFSNYDSNKLKKFYILMKDLVFYKGYKISNDAFNLNEIYVIIKGSVVIIEIKSNEIIQILNDGAVIEFTNNKSLLKPDLDNDKNGNSRIDNKYFLLNSALSNIVSVIVYSEDIKLKVIETEKLKKLL